MSEVRLLLRDAEGDWSGTVHGSQADRAIAALSADPATRAELESAFGRFAKPTKDHRFLANLLPGCCEEPHDAGIVIIDLVARLVAVDSTYSSPTVAGQVCYHDGNSATMIWLTYHLADDWLLMSDTDQWSAVAANRRKEQAARPLLNAREVFYGRPLLEFIASETFRAFTPQKMTDEGVTYQTLQTIHADWLLTPRDDLGGICPRDVALERRAHLMRDLQDQCERWTRLDESPPGLDPSSFAFQFGGFGTHELVMYYDLVRALLWCCWERLIQLQTSARDQRSERITLAEFLTSEVPRLEQFRDDWLETPDWEFHGRTPRSIIDRERARLPEIASAQEAIIDPDCPCCQMSAELPGPTFWHLDGSEMDDDFAFDLYHCTREEWEAEQREWEEHSRRIDAEYEERERRNATDSGSPDTGEDSVWSSSFSAEGGSEVPVGVRLFGIGCHLAELISDLRGDAECSTNPQIQQSIDQLNRDFGNLREILQNTEPSLAIALINPVCDRFADTLANVASCRPDLSAKCQSLMRHLETLLDLNSPDSNWDCGDSNDPH